MNFNDPLDSDNPILHESEEEWLRLQAFLDSHEMPSLELSKDISLVDLDRFENELPSVLHTTKGVSLSV